MSTPTLQPSATTQRLPASLITFNIPTISEGKDILTPNLTDKKVVLHTCASRLADYSLIVSASSPLTPPPHHRVCVLQFSGSVVVLFLLRQHTFNVSFCQHLFESEADSSVTTSTRAGEYGTHATNTTTTTNVAFDLNPFFALLFQRSINGPDADGRRQRGHYSVAVRGEPIALVHQHYRRGCSFRDGDFHEVSLLTLHLCGTWKLYE